jgi:hypothetical protein
MSSGRRGGRTLKACFSSAVFETAAIAGYWLALPSLQRTSELSKTRKLGQSGWLDSNQRHPAPEAGGLNRSPTSRFIAVGPEGLEPSPRWLRARDAAANTWIPSHYRSHSQQGAYAPRSPAHEKGPGVCDAWPALILHARIGVIFAGGGPAASRTTRSPPAPDTAHCDG